MTARAYAIADRSGARRAVSDRLPAALRVYRLLSAAAAPLSPLLLAIAPQPRQGTSATGSASGAAKREFSAARRAAGLAARGQRRRTGERAAADRRIAARDIAMLVTTGTVTSGEPGRAAAAARRHPSIRAARRAALRAAFPRPLAAGPGAVRRIRPVAEPDHRSRARGVPMILVNGRLSESSFRRWHYLPAPIVNLLQRFDLCLARTPPTPSG